MNNVLDMLRNLQSMRSIGQLAVIPELKETIEAFETLPANHFIVAGSRKIAITDVAHQPKPHKVVTSGQLAGFGMWGWLPDKADEIVSSLPVVPNEKKCTSPACGKKNDVGAVTCYMCGGTNFVY